MQFGVIVGIIIVALVIYTFIEPYLLQVKEDTIISEKIPPEFDGLRIAFASDIHCGLMLSPEYQSKVLDLINSQKPDIILLGGDYTYSNQGDFEICLNGLAKLNAPHGVYAVSGNHDNWASSSLTRKTLEDGGIKVIDNSGFWLKVEGEKIWVGGVGDLWTQRQDINSTLGDAQNSDYKIVLSHNPRYIEVIEEDTVDLMLSGHTHGGQIFPIRLIAQYIGGKLQQTHVGGRYEVGKTTLIVSNGVGAVFTPQRFLTRPQINIITLKTK